METLTWLEVKEKINNGENYFKDIQIFSKTSEPINLIKDITFENCTIYIDYVFTVEYCVFKNYIIQNIYGCTVRKSFFYCCNIKNTNIKYGESYDSVFKMCNFYNSEFNNYKFYDCDFSASNFYHVKISDTKFINPITNEGTTFLNLSCPEEGSFIAYKKVNNHLIKLLIPSDAKRSSATTLKCRCSYAKVLEITNISTNENVDSILNKNIYNDTLYKVNEFVYPDSWDNNRWNECSHGIHFFMNKNNAINY